MIMNIRVKAFEQTCAACPSQWEGTTVDNKHIYIRYRYGYLSVQVDDVTICEKQVGESLAGVMSTETMLMKLLDYGIDLQILAYNGQIIVGD